MTYRLPTRRAPRTSHLQARITLQAIAHRRLSWVELIAHARFGPPVALGPGSKLAARRHASVLSSLSAAGRWPFFYPRQQLRPPARPGALDDPPDRLRGAFGGLGATDCRHGPGVAFERRRLRHCRLRKRRRASRRGDAPAGDAAAEGLVVPPADRASAAHACCMARIPASLLPPPEWPAIGFKS